METLTMDIDWNRPRAIAEALSGMMEEFNFSRDAARPFGRVGVCTGFDDLDNVISGLKPGSLVVIAGRPSLGKSCFALNIASHVALEQKLPTLIFSMDFSSMQVAARLVCQTGSIDIYDFRIGNMDADTRARAGVAIEKLKSADLYIDETPALKVSDICSRTQKVFDKHGQLGVVVIDYLQAMNPIYSEGGSAKNYNAVMFALRQLAKEINAPIIVLSRLSRRLEKRKNKRPRLSDLPSEGIFQNADLMLFLYREEVYDPDTQDKGIAEVIIGRNRHGPVGIVRLRFLAEFGCFGVC